MIGTEIVNANAFTALLSPHFILEELENHPASVVGLWPDYSIAYVNRAWAGFATDNNGQPVIGNEWGIGARYLDAVAEPLRPFYAALLARAAQAGSTLHPISHLYECSSATLYRQFSMRVYPLPDRAGFVVVNALVVEMPHDLDAKPAHEADSARYVGARGVIVQCAHCRLVQHGTDTTRWDWIPDWVEHSPSGTSHGVCPLCFDYYFPDTSA